jgi:hypothetical protein
MSALTLTYSPRLPPPPHVLYGIAAVGYGVSRKSRQVENAKVRIYNNLYRSYDTVPMLTTTKVMIVALSGFFAYGGWPIYAYIDANRAELKMRGGDLLYAPRHPQNALDYLLM